MLLLLCDAAAGILAILQSSTRWIALSTTCATVSDTPCQSFKFLCFHMLHKRAAKRWLSSCERSCTKRKIKSAAQLELAQACCTFSHIPALCHNCTAKEQSKKTWWRSWEDYVWIGGMWWNLRLCLDWWYVMELNGMKWYIIIFHCLDLQKVNGLEWNTMELIPSNTT